MRSHKFGSCDAFRDAYVHDSMRGDGRARRDSDRLAAREGMVPSSVPSSCAAASRSFCIVVTYIRRLDRKGHGLAWVVRRASSVAVHVRAPACVASLVHWVMRRGTDALCSPPRARRSWKGVFAAPLSHPIARPWLSLDGRVSVGVPLLQALSRSYTSVAPRAWVLPWQEQASGISCDSCHYVKLGRRCRMHWAMQLGAPCISKGAFAC